MSKIALINCYFGSWPNYFNLWLETASYNTKYDFIFFTDIEDNLEYPKNVKIINITFEKLKSKIQSFFDFKISLKNPYKLCEYKPAYGMIFSEYLKGYTHWGYFDIDTVTGDFDKFISEDLLNTFDKIYEQGHLQIYKNSDKIRELFKTEEKLPCESYIEAFTTRRICHFDESGPTSFPERLNFSWYKHPEDMADLDFSSFRFKCFAVKDKNYPPMVLKWENGVLYIAYVMNNEVHYRETEYAHFQKRNMKNCVQNPKNGFIAIPNKFIDNREITVDFILENSPENYNYKEYKKAYRKSQIKKLFDGTLWHRIKGLFRK